MFKNFILNRTAENEATYKQYNNALRTLIRKAEANYFKSKFSNKQNGIKEMWKHLGYLLCPKRTKKRNSVGRLVINGKTIKNDKEIANALNTYFTNIGQDLSGKIIPTEQSFMDYLPNRVPKSIFMKPMDDIEIATEINLLHNKKSVLDIFNISIIKYIKDEIIPALVLIFNKSITEGIFPDMLKTAKVIPIFKKGDDFIPGNYRPISLLSVFDKLLEKIIYRRLKSFLDKFKILYKYQFGFRTNHSTSHALIDITEYIYNALDKGHFVLGIYIDLKKAFDTVNHDILIKKLDHYGIRGVTLDWFRSYLKDRKQVTYINETLSEVSKMCNFGVPQGSVLGPLLFLLYINNINHSLNEVIIKLFADDTNCFFSGEDFDSLMEIVTSEMNSLQNWINANKLTINFDPNKSCYNVFKPKNKNLPSGYDRGIQMGENILTYKESTNYLGIILDDKMNWKAHIAETTSKITKYAGIFAKVRYMMPRRCLTTLYNSFTFPKINYGIEAYGNTTLETLRPLKVAQNRILKILQFKPHKSNTNKLYSDFSVLKMEDIFKFSMCNITHKYIHHKEAVPQALHTIFLQHNDIHSYNTRNKKDLHAQEINTITYGAKQISYITRQCWNELPKEIKQEQNTNTFRQNLKKHFLSAY